MVPMKWYPRSLLRLIVLGYVLVLAPLLVAVGYFLVSLNEHEEHYEASIRRSAQWGKLGWELPNNLHQMETLVRRYELLKDDSLVADYQELRQRWREKAKRLVDMLPGQTDIEQAVAAMNAVEEAAFKRLKEEGDPHPLGKAIDYMQTGIHPLIEKGDSILRQSDQAYLGEEDDLRTRLLTSISIALTVAVVIVIISRRMLSRILGRVERAIVQLGKAELDKPIRLYGPEDLRWIGKRLDWLRQRLLTLEEDRTRLLRHLSHELKTPLAALREGASLLAEGAAGPLNEGQTKVARIMENNTVRLTGLIEGLLRLQQAGHACERIQLTPIRLDLLIQQVLATHQLATRDKHLRVSGSLTTATVDGGQEELTTIFNNLVSNAIKYCPDGGQIRITLTVAGRYAVFDIHNEGPRISPENAERIFEPFYRAPETREVAGVGLGLAIAREYAHAHGGHLVLADGEQGVHFKATFPLSDTP